MEGSKQYSLHIFYKMKQTAINKIGKIGRANIKARKMIAIKCESIDLNFCEIQLGGCLGGIYLAPAHRHKRAWYQGDADLLAEFKQWVCACQICHNQIEFDNELTEEVFDRLRGEE